MKYKNFIVYFIALLLQSSCAVEKCELPKVVEYAPSVLRNFEGFNSGMYWKCYNQDSSKIDSIWIEQLDWDVIMYPKENCYAFSKYTYKLTGKYLSVGNEELTIEFENFDKNDPYTMVTFKSKEGGILYTISSKNSSSTLENVTHFDSYKVPFRGDIIMNGFIFPQVGKTGTKMSRLWIDPKIGIVQFVTQDGIDTFTCLKYSYKE